MPTLIPAPKKRPPSPFKQVTAFHTDTSALERFIKQVTGRSYPICACELWGDDESHEFTVDGEVHEYDEEKVHALMHARIPKEHSLRSILNALCRDGHIERGLYVVQAI